MNAPREFRPELLSRSSEWINWFLAILSMAAWVFLRSRVAAVSGWYFAFVLVMLLLAAGTSLSNWIDRKTVLTLKPEGIDFRNGLRDVSLSWDQLREMRVLPTRFGKRVYVSGSLDHPALTRNTNFSFQTLSVLERRGQVRSKMGFADGDFLIEQILQSSNLEKSGQDNPTEQGVYYSRP